MELAWNDCDVESPDDNCTADEKQSQHLKAVAVVWWPAGRRRKSHQTHYYSVLQEHQGTQLLHLERATATNADSPWLQSRYPHLPGTSQHPLNCRRTKV